MLEPELYKIRSVSACMGCAYHLFTDNFKKIFRRMWLPILVTSLCMSVAMLMAQNMERIQLAGSGMYSPELMMAMGEYSIVQLISLIPALWMGGRLFGLLNDRTTGWNVRRLIKGYVSVIVAMIVVELVFFLIGMAVGGALTATAFLSLGFLVIFVASVPLIYSWMKYFMDPDMRLGMLFGKAYKAGWRHWGFLFGLFFLVALIMVVICVILFLPAMGLETAAQANAAGMLGGDASGLPAAFSVLTYVVFACTYFILYFVEIWMTFNIYYGYGSVEAREHGDDVEREVLDDGAAPFDGRRIEEGGYSSEPKNDFEEIR